MNKNPNIKYIKIAIIAVIVVMVAVVSFSLVKKTEDKEFLGDWYLYGTLPEGTDIQSKDFDKKEITTMKEWAVIDDSNEIMDSKITIDENGIKELRKSSKKGSVTYEWAKTGPHEYSATMVIKKFVDETKLKKPVTMISKCTKIDDMMYVEVTYDDKTFSPVDINVYKKVENKSKK